MVQANLDDVQVRVIKDVLEVNELLRNGPSQLFPEIQHAVQALFVLFGVDADGFKDENG